MIFIGFAESFKRTFSTIYFGRRKFETYKPKLEEILGDIILISEVAELALETSAIAEEIGLDNAKIKSEVETTSDKRKQARKSHVRWSSVKFGEDSSFVGSAAGSADKGDGKDNDDDVGKDDKDDDLTEDGDSDDPDSNYRPNASFGYEDSSRRLSIKDLLIKWEEPAMAKRDKVRIVRRSVNVFTFAVVLSRCSSYQFPVI